MKTQLQIFYEEQRKIGEVNELFLDLVRDGMTRQELDKNIERRPAVWSRFDNWLPKLPDAQDVWEDLNWNELTCKAAETGADRELGFDLNKFHEREYEKYLEQFQL